MEDNESQTEAMQVDHPLIGKRVSFRVFGGGEAMSGTVTGAMRDMTGTVYLDVESENGPMRIMEQNVIGVEFTEEQAASAGE